MAYTILLAEDEEAVAKSIQQKLERLGHTVTKVVTKEEESIYYAKKLSPDFVIMDIFLELNGSGMNAAKQINEDAKVPILFVTAADYDNFKRTLEELPYPCEVLPKPVTTTRLAERIDRLMKLV